MSNGYKIRQKSTKSPVHEEGRLVTKVDKPSHFALFTFRRTIHVTWEFLLTFSVKKATLIFT